MNKKVGITIGIFAVVVAGVGLLGWWLSKDKPVDIPEEVLNSQEPNEEVEKNNEDKYVGAPLPNIINRAGTIKKVKSSSVIINGPDDTDVTIFITEDTKIYGPDGKEKVINELEEGMYITVDIDGDKVENNSEEKFDALIIYISGK